MVAISIGTISSRSLARLAGKLALLAAPLALNGCGSGENTKSVSEAATTCDPTAVLDFESTSSWSGVGSTVVANTRRVQGARSLQATGGPNLAVKSAAFCLPAQQYGLIGLYIALKDPSASINAVTLTVKVSSSSRGLSNVLVGSKVVSGLGAGLFQRVELPMPASLGTALASGATDAKVTLELAGSVATAYLLDGMAIQAASSVASPTGGPIESRTLTIKYLPPAQLLDTALSTTTGLAISDRAQLSRPSGGYATVVSTGGPATQIGSGTHTGDVLSVPSVAFASTSVVHGKVTTNGGVSPANFSGATGGIQTAASLVPQTLTWNVPFLLSDTPLTLDPDVVRSASPGAFAAVTVNPRAQLTLGSGTYFFKSLDVEATGQLILANTNGPVVIYVRDTLTLHGALNYRGVAGDMLLGYLGTSSVDIDTTFVGTLVAPSANVRFGVGGTPHIGSAFAKFIRVDPDVKFNFAPPFALVGTALDPQQCTDALLKSAWAQSNSPTEFQKASLRYCGASDAGACENALIARVNVDYYTAAARLLQRGMGTPAHMALLLDRERKVKLFHANEALSCAILNTDTDGDLVPSPQDACPNTPPLTPTLENGCTDSQLPLAPDIDEVLTAVPKLVFAADPRCKDAPGPAVPSPFGAWRSPADPSRGKALWVARDRDTSGCPTWYQLEAQLTDGSFQSIIFTPSEDVDLSWIQKPAHTLQFNIHDGDPGGRGAWAKYNVWTRVYRARVFNAAGRRSDWSNWFRPGQDGCAAGACDF